LHAASSCGPPCQTPRGWSGSAADKSEIQSTRTEHAPKAEYSKAESFTFLALKTGLAPSSLGPGARSNHPLIDELVLGAEDGEGSRHHAGSSMLRRTGRVGGRGDYRCPRDAPGKACNVRNLLMPVCRPSPAALCGSLCGPTLKHARLPCPLDEMRMHWAGQALLPNLTKMLIGASITDHRRAGCSMGA